MSTKVLKCSNCNIVINEVLSFVQNKCEVMNEESLVQICATAFTEEDVEKAKGLLYDSVQTSIRNITRKNKGKKNRNLEDIISIFKQTDPEKIPIFVARDLQKLPPVTFDHIDVTKLLKDLLVLRNDVNNIKDNYVNREEFIVLSTDFQSLISSSVDNTKNFKVNNMRKNDVLCVTDLHNNQPSRVVTPRKQSSLQFDKRNNCLCASTGAIDQAPLTPGRANDNSGDMVSHQQESHKQQLTSAPSSLSCVQAIRSIDKNNMQYNNSINASQNQKTMAEVLRQPGVWKQSKPNKEWIEVQNKRYKNRFIGKMGTASYELQYKFKAAEISVPLFINNVDKSVVMNDIASYILHKTQVSVKIEKVDMKREKEYNAYKIFVPHNKLTVFLNDNLWPEGVKFRKFINFRNRINERTSLSTTQHDTQC